MQPKGDCDMSFDMTNIAIRNEIRNNQTRFRIGEKYVCPVCNKYQTLNEKSLSKHLEFEHNWQYVRGILYAPTRAKRRFSHNR